MLKLIVERGSNQVNLTAFPKIKMIENFLISLREETLRCKSYQSNLVAVFDYKKLSV